MVLSGNACSATARIISWTVDSVCSRKSAVIAVAARAAHNIEHRVGLSPAWQRDHTVHVKPFTLHHQLPLITFHIIHAKKVSTFSNGDALKFIIYQLILY